MAEATAELMPSGLKLEDCLVRNKKGEITGVNFDKVAAYVTQRAHIIHIMETGKTYLYQEGVYIDALDLLQDVLYRIFGEFVTSTGQSVLVGSCVKEIMNRINAASAVSIERLDVAGNVFNAANGILDLDTHELYMPTPADLILTRSPTAYDPNAECPAFLEFMDQAVETQAQKEAIYEMIGYVMWPQYNVHKAFMLHGAKRTGKGTLLRVIESVIGPKDCSHVSLQDLCEKRFSRAQLFGKKLNTSGDLPAVPIKDPGIFKNVTGEDTIDAEYKYGQIFSFRNRAKLLFSANTLPRLRYEDDAFFSRWIVFPFNNSMFGREDKGLTAKLTTPQERSGILNLGLEGLRRLRDNNWVFSYGEAESGRLYRRASNPLVAFLEDKCEASAGYVLKADLFKAYNDWARENGLPPATSKIAFGKEMMDQGSIPVETARPMVVDAANGSLRQAEAWSGIQLKE